jgi:uncharacterized protein
VRLVIDTKHLDQRPAGRHVAARASHHAVARRLVRSADLGRTAGRIDARDALYTKIRERLTPALAGRLINELRDIAVVVKDLPAVTVCADPYDNYLLAMTAGGGADFLVTGNKRHLLGLRLYEGTRIITVRDFLALNKRLP